MGQDEPFFIVVTSRAGRLASKLDPCLQEIGATATRYLAPEGLADKPLRANEILIVDFVSVEAQAEKTLRQPIGNLLLGLLPESEITSPSSRTLCCSEVVAWPGNCDELKAKLQRLSRMLFWEDQLEQTLTLNQNLIGKSSVFREIISDIHKYSRCDAPVLILGETGTGKEQVARAIHYVGLGRDKPFIAVNCGAIPDNLIENELFGHVRGAYTDAKQSQPGLIEQAEGGTLFLDEIEVISQKGQVALLRFLQESEYRPLGSQTTKKAQLRLITSSNESIEDLIGDGHFRKDLYYRINILSLNLPPLRERPGDIVFLAEHFLDKYRDKYQQFNKYIDPETLEWMERYLWPGNVRELENLILREFLLSDTPCISIRHTGKSGDDRRKNLVDRRYRNLYESTFHEAKSIVVKDFERSYLKNVLEDANGNISQAARLAGKERRTFVRLLEKNGFGKMHFSND